MRTVPLVSSLVFATLILCPCAGQHTVRLITSGYRGVLGVNTSVCSYVTTDTMVLVLSTGPHYLETGAAVGGSLITFDVNDSGAILNVAPSGSAEPGKAPGTLVLRTVTFRVDPGRYAGDYTCSAFKVQKDAKRFRGRQRIVLIAGQVYQLDNAAAVMHDSCCFCIGACNARYTSSFTFLPSADGRVLKVSHPAAAAAGNKGRLRLKSTPVHITRDMIPKDGWVSWSGDPWNQITQPTTIHVIPSLLTGLQRSDRKDEWVYFIEGMFEALKPWVPMP